MGRNVSQLYGQGALDLALFLSTHQLGDFAHFQLCNVVSRSGKHYFLMDGVRIKGIGSIPLCSGLSPFPIH